MEIIKYWDDNYAQYLYGIQKLNNGKVTKRLKGFNLDWAKRQAQHYKLVVPAEATDDFGGF